MIAHMCQMLERSTHFHPTACLCFAYDCRYFSITQSLHPEENQLFFVFSEIIELFHNLLDQDSVIRLLFDIITVLYLVHPVYMLCLCTTRIIYQKIVGSTIDVSTHSLSRVKFLFLFIDTTKCLWRQILCKCTISCLAICIRKNLVNVTLIENVKCLRVSFLPCENMFSVYMHQQSATK